VASSTLWHWPSIQRKEVSSVETMLCSSIVHVVTLICIINRKEVSSVENENAHVVIEIQRKEVSSVENENALIEPSNLKSSKSGIHKSKGRAKPNDQQFSPESLNVESHLMKGFNKLVGVLDYVSEISASSQEDLLCFHID